MPSGPVVFGHGRGAFMMRVGIVGGGPGGLFAARLLEKHGAGLCEAVIFEATGRLGGKVLTRRFDARPALYEAGVAELYDYSHLGPDPLRALVDELGLATIRMSGPAVVLGEAILRNGGDIRRHFGRATLQAIQAFYDRCAALMPRSRWFEGSWCDDNAHPWAGLSFREVLDEIEDPVARHYVEVAARSDLATEPHLTSALDGLKNVLMDDPRYLGTYSVVGGNERIVQKVASELSTEVRLESLVLSVGRSGDQYRLRCRRNGAVEEHLFDQVVIALPNDWLGTLHFEDEALRHAMLAHLAHYDHPAHYLRVSLLYDRPFWRRAVPGSFFMADIFGGCCLYDEGSRHPDGGAGALGILLAGSDAMARGNWDDDRLVRAADAALPACLGGEGVPLIDSHVQRWIGTLNGLPGGYPVHDTRRRHVPAPGSHPGVILVGDYLFDSTLNGAMDSADYATDLVIAEARRRHFGVQVQAAPGAVAIDQDYFDRYDGENDYEDSFEEYFDASYTADLVAEAFGLKPPYTLLDCGSASGLTLAEFAKLGIEAWGIENNPAIHARTRRKWRARNRLGDVCAMPFEDGAFDILYETCLCYLPPDKVDRAIAEMYRVARVGVIFGSIVPDMTMEVIEEHDLFENVQTLMPLGDWADRFLAAGFRLAVRKPKRLQALWRIETEANEGGPAWYAGPDDLRCCFFEKPRGGSPARRSGIIVAKDELRGAGQGGGGGRPRAVPRLELPTYARRRPVR